MSRTMADIRARLLGPVCPSGPEITREIEGSPPVVTNLKQFHVKPSAGEGRPYPAEWSSDDLLTLYQMRAEQGWATQAIAAKLGRSDLAVRLKLARMGWTEPHKRRA